MSRFYTIFSCCFFLSNFFLAQDVIEPNNSITNLSEIKLTDLYGNVFVEKDEPDSIFSKYYNLNKSGENVLISNQLEFSHASGYYTNSFLLKIRFIAGSDDVIYYTLDGSIPNTSSNVYGSEILLEDMSENGVFKATVVRACSYVDTLRTSEIINATYLITQEGSERFTMPVISLITDPENFFNYNIGIYVAGVNYDPSDPNWSGNYYMSGVEWEREVHLQYFDIYGDVRLDQDAGVRIHGGKQRAAKQKSLKFYARDEYGDDSFDYQLLPQKRKNRFKRFLLRTSYGCWNNTVIKDPVAAQVVKGLNFNEQDYRPVIVLLNGDYWGIQTIRDYQSIHYFSNKYHINKDSVNIGQDKTVYDGTSIDYQIVDSILDSYTINTDSFYNQIVARYDFDNLLDYYNAEIYLNNYDWPSGNRRWWSSCEYDNRKMRWILYDADATFNARGGVSFDALNKATVPSGGWPNAEKSCKLIKNVILNDRIKNDFITSAAYLMNYYFDKDSIVPIINKIKLEYAPEMDEHIKRWSFYTYSSWENVIKTALINFANARKEYVIGHYVNKFGLSGSSKMQVIVNNDEYGQVYINRKPIPLREHTATYFNDVPMVLTAVAKPGYKFKCWNNTDNHTTNPDTIILTQDTIVYATFELDVTSNYSIKINEMMAKNDGVIFDEFNEDEDWIELYNGGENAVDLSSYYISDDAELPFKHSLMSRQNDTLTIDSDEYLLLFADNDTAQGVTHTNFKLNTDGETLLLVKNCLNIPCIIDSISYPDISKNNSWGRFPNGKDICRLFYSSTPGAFNWIEYFNSGLYINEVLAYNINDTTDNYGEHEDWIEIYNSSSQPVSIDGFYISDDVNDLKKCLLTSENTGDLEVPAKGFLLLYADKDTLQGSNHLNFKLSSDGETIVLSKYDNEVSKIVSEFSYGRIESDYSIGLENDGGDKVVHFSSNLTTPGYSNIAVVDIPQSEMDVTVNVYPNPANKYLKIKSDNTISSISIFDVSGKVVKKYNLFSNTQVLDISAISQGIYILEVVHQTTERIKIVVKK